jgi:hypothetical protein
MGEKLNAAEVIQFALKAVGRTQKSLAEEIGMNPQSFSRKLVNDTLTAREFFAAIAALRLVATYTDGDTGTEVQERVEGVVPHLSMVVDKVRYDTHKADAVCHVKVLDGWVVELYRDALGRHFLAVSSTWESTRDTIMPCSAEDATRFRHACLDDESEYAEKNG